MADWTQPTILTNYVAFVDEIKARDVDAITLQLNALINPPTGSIKLLRAPTKFQEWDGVAFVDKVLSLEGGGTGAAVASGARTNLGLGTMAVQNANAIAVTGGTISNINSSGGLSHNGNTFVLNPVNGNHGIAIIGNTGNVYCMSLTSCLVPEQANGLYIAAGISFNDSAVYIVNRNGTAVSCRITGTGQAHFPHRLVIPVGVDFWATT